MSCCARKRRTGDAPSSILYRILNGDAQTRHGLDSRPAEHPPCSCEKLFTLRSPLLLHAAARKVLFKTFKFVKNIPYFRSLPLQDQLRLVRKSWAPLLVLGLAQEGEDVDFEAVVETQQRSFLHQILTQHKEPRQCGGVAQTGVTWSEVQSVKKFVDYCRSLGIILQEHAFLQGAILFNYEVNGDYIRALQTESALYKNACHRSSSLLQLLSVATTLNPETVARMFFTTMKNVDQYVLAMFYES